MELIDFAKSASFEIDIGPRIDFRQLIKHDIDMRGMNVDGLPAFFLYDGRSLGYESPSVGSVILTQSNRTKVIVSTDSTNEAFKVLFKSSNPKEKIHRVFPLKDGWLVQFGDPLQTGFMGAEGLFTEFKGPQFPWHGTFGVGINSIGTVLFTEYQAGYKSPLEIGVWRYTGAGSSPTKTLKVMAADKIGVIRHFHTVIPDPFEVGTWIASSGDVGSQNKLWFSKDDGRTWIEPKLDVSGMPSGKLDQRRVLRFTSAKFTSKDELIWATDDNLGTKYSWSCRAKVDYLSNTIHVAVVDALAENLARSLITAGDEHLFITESKTNVENVEFGTLDKKGRLLRYFNAPNKQAESSPVTVSSSSSEFVDGVAFFRHQGSLDTYYTGTVLASIIPGKR